VGSIDTLGWIGFLVPREGEIWGSNPQAEYAITNCNQTVSPLHNNEELCGLGTAIPPFSRLLLSLLYQKRGRWCAAHVHIAWNTHLRKHQSHLANSERTTTDLLQRPSLPTHIQPPAFSFYDATNSTRKIVLYN